MSARSFVRAIEKGVEWAEGLKAGDRYIGSGKEAAERYPGSVMDADGFSSGALSVLGSMAIHIDGDDVILAIERRGGRKRRSRAAKQ